MLDKLALRFQKYAPVALRWGLGLVFILFGWQKLTNPGQATSEIQLVLDWGIADAAALNYYLGLLEILTAAAMIFGVKVRYFSILSGILVAGFLLSFLKEFGLSLNPGLYRDAGLVGSSVALFLLGAGPLSVDEWWPTATKNKE